jgi:hypothetical protein
MTEQYGYDENDTDDGNDDGSDERYVQLTRQQIRAMERDAKQARKAQEELAQVRQELALSKAGIGSLTERQQKALLASIDGDLTADSVRLAAEELGFVQPPAASPQDEEAAALNRMSQASAGAADPGSEDSIAKLERAAREGGREALLAQLAADGHLIAPAS